MTASKPYTLRRNNLVVVGGEIIGGVSDCFCCETQHGRVGTDWIWGKGQPVSFRTRREAAEAVYAEWLARQ